MWVTISIATADQIARDLLIGRENMVLIECNYLETGGGQRILPSLYNEPQTVGDEHTESHRRHVQDALGYDESNREKHVGRREKR